MTETHQLDPEKVRDISPTEAMGDGSISVSPFDTPRAVAVGEGQGTVEFSMKYPDDERGLPPEPLDEALAPVIRIVRGKYSGKLLVIQVGGDLKDDPSLYRTISRRLASRAETMESVSQRLNFQLVARVFEQRASTLEWLTGVGPVSRLIHEGSKVPAKPVKTVKIIHNDPDGSQGRAAMQKDPDCIAISTIRMSSNRKPPHDTMLAIVNNGDGTVNVTWRMPGKTPIVVPNLSTENGVLVIPDEAVGYK